MKDRLAGQVAVVTGAGRGLGRAVAVALARAGAKLWVCARTKSELEKTRKQIHSVGGKAESYQVDLGDSEACDKFAAVVLEKSSRVDILVNNAGVLWLTPFEKLSTAAWSQTLAVNLTAPYLLTKAFLSGMREGGGSVINVSSRAGVLGFKDETAYCVSKFGLEGLTRALAIEFEGTKFSANTITPGLRIKPTSMTEQDFEELSEEERQSWHDPDELTPAFVFLAALRGELSGLRFDAHRLSEAMRRDGFDLNPERAKEFSE
jgi:NAD(P)-dependent dehydrogenase (short-subunit alcohol dehydrogenase family)